ncbi:transposase-like protein [Runella defluvii]|uniref:Transposase-like protein n=1 Tax=Runella defluvii TaxID=370973 RepID=A0A7W6EP03_9BACT|nr:transposase [Runella defluvii]MBB3837089.1 transposase-like protein [Runella defluvii]
MDKLHNSKNLSKVVRHFSVDFKKQIIAQLDANLLTIADIVRQYEVSAVSVCRWRQQYSKHYQKPTRLVIEMESEALKTKALLERNAELERIIGQKQLKIDYLEKLIEIASSDLKIDLKKSTNTPLSITSNLIEKT